MKKALFLFLSLILITPQITPIDRDGAKIISGILAIAIVYAGYHYYSSQDNVQSQEQQLPQPPYQINYKLSETLQEDDKKHVQIVLNNISQKPTEEKSSQPKPQPTQNNSRTQEQQRALEEHKKQQHEIEREREKKFAKNLAEIKNKKEDRTIDTIIEYQLVELY
jgi:outer membrane biosynthesis protein TonB